VISVQYGNANACEAKATAIAKAIPANNVFIVIFPISRLVVRGLPLTPSNAAQGETHIHPCNRKSFDGAVAVARSVAVAIWALDSFSWRSLRSLCSTMPEPRRRFGDSHYVSEKLRRQKRLRSLYFRSTQGVRKGAAHRGEFRQAADASAVTREAEEKLGRQDAQIRKREAAEAASTR
jgi:hypothetical protein